MTLAKLTSTASPLDRTYPSEKELNVYNTCFFLNLSISLIFEHSLFPKKWKKEMEQAGAELCQAQHQLWKMLLEELDLDEEKIFQSG